MGHTCWRNYYEIKKKSARALNLEILFHRDWDDKINYCKCVFKIVLCFNGLVTTKPQRKFFFKLFSHSGQVLKIIDKNLSHVDLHKKFSKSTPKIFSIYQTSLNLFHPVKTSLEEIQSVTLNYRRNTRLSFIKANKNKVGLNLVKIRLHSVTNVVDKKWMDLSFWKL